MILGTLRGNRLSLEEIHRFANGPVYVSGAMHWDIARLRQEIETGLSLAATRAAAENLTLESVSVDAWGVDYVLVDEASQPVAPAYHYRDPRTGAGVEAAHAAVPAEVIFAETGIQFMPINTLYQLLAHQTQAPAELEEPNRLLPIADYLHACLCGVRRAERSAASTTQLYNPVTRDWSAVLLSRFGLPESLLPPIVDSATVLGPLLPEVTARTGLPPVQVTATCSHDTGAAVAAVPEEGDDWAFLSSGTWSLLGVELTSPLMSEAVRAANFTNEIGLGGAVRLLKNIAGLWIIQECRRTWQAAGNEYTYEELTRLAEAAPPLRSLIRPDNSRFLAPDEMPAKVAAFCRETGQPVPETPGQMVRCILESLALSYQDTLEQCERLTGRTIRRLHIVGGGCRNLLLSQFAANATNRDVQTGPVEATAIGNLLLQAVALGHLDGVSAIRETVRASFDVYSFTPADRELWADAFGRFQQLETTSL